MAATPGVRVVGLGKLSRALKDSAEGLAELKDANAKAAGIVEEYAIARVPVRTGALLATLRSSGTKTAGKVRAGTNSNVTYAGVIHWGWRARHITPRLFISGPAKEAEPQWAQAYYALLEHIIDTHLNGKRF